MSNVKSNNPDTPSGAAIKTDPIAVATETAWRVAMYMGQERKEPQYMARHIYHDGKVYVTVRYYKPNADLLASPMPASDGMEKISWLVAKTMSQ